MKKAKRKGFTLVEIMIVVAIIALLAAIVIPNLLRARINANEAAAQATLRSFAVACENYAAANAALYPTSVDDLLNPIPPFFSYDLRPYNNPNNLRDGYYYQINFAGNGYTLTARAVANTGEWDYQLTTGALLKRSPRGEDNWAAY